MLLISTYLKWQFRQCRPYQQGDYQPKSLSIDSKVWQPFCIKNREPTWYLLTKTSTYDGLLQKRKAVPLLLCTKASWGIYISISSIRRAVKFKSTTWMLRNTSLQTRILSSIFCAVKFKPTTLNTTQYKPTNRNRTGILCRSLRTGILQKTSLWKQEYSATLNTTTSI